MAVPKMSLPRRSAVWVALCVVIGFLSARRAHADDLASAGDGPPIFITCVGSSIPVTVHVTANIPKEADSSVDRGWLDKRLEWDFGDPNGRWNTVPGWNAAHVYDRPGQYTITLTVREPGGGVKTRTTWIRVLPDDRRKIFVSADGSDANAGTTPDTPVQTAARAFALAKSNAGVYFRRGDTFDIVSTIILNGQNLLIGSYVQPGQSPATAPLPILRKIEGPPKMEFMFLAPDKSRDITFHALAFDSIWPIESKFGAGRVPARAVYIAGHNVTIRNCSFNQVSDGANTDPKSVGFLLQDCTFSDGIRAYCYWGNGSDHVVIGNVMNHSRQEHLIRCSEPGVSRLLVAYNDLSRWNNSKGSIELRNANWFYIADNHINGGTMRVGPQDDGIDKSVFKNWANTKCTWGIVQDNRFDRIFVQVRLGSEHIMVRNNVVRIDDSVWAFLIACEKPGWDDVRKIIDVTLENNTAINNGTSGTFLFVQGKPISLTVKNNLYIAPNIPPGGANDSAVFSTDTGLEGIQKLEGNVYPQGPGGIHRAGKSPVEREQWTANPNVKNERWEAVMPDEDDNPPTNLGAGAKLGTDKRERDAKRKAEGKPEPADYKPPTVSPAPAK